MSESFRLSCKLILYLGVQVTAMLTEFDETVQFLLQFY